MQPLLPSDRSRRGRWTAALVLVLLSVPAPVLAQPEAGKDEVVALGTSLWWLWLSRDAKHGSDNARLLEQLLSRPRR